MMTVLQAGAAVTLWRSGRFDTLDISGLLSMSEPDVVRLLDEVREHERGIVRAAVADAFGETGDRP